MLVGHNANGGFPKGNGIRYGIKHDKRLGSLDADNRQYYGQQIE